MDSKQIEQNLNNIFSKEDTRIVFWYDAVQSFEHEFIEVKLDNVVKWRLDQHSMIASKREVEITQPQSKFLLYAPSAKPQPKENWLLDILLYSQEFHADKATIIWQQLKLNDHKLIKHIGKRLDFFQAKLRTKSLLDILNSDDEEQKLDLKILCVVTKAQQPTIEAITMSLFHGFRSKKIICFRDIDHPQQSMENSRWEDVQKFGMEESFWLFVSSYWGYQKEKPTLKDLFVHLTITHMQQEMRQEALPADLQKFVLPSSEIKNKEAVNINSSIFISNWMFNQRYSNDYVGLSREIEEEMELKDVFVNFSLDILVHMDTFEKVEQCIIVTLKNAILNKEYLSAEEILSIMQVRHEKFWCFCETIYTEIYKALTASLHLFENKKLLVDSEKSFCFKSTKSMWQAYQENLYLFDTHYRHFYTALNQDPLKLDIIKEELQKAVEDLYCNWFLPELATAWNCFVEENLIFNKWSFGKTNIIREQKLFYSNHIAEIAKKYETKGGKKRVYVIISDALRYEVAKELEEQINKEQLRRCEISAELGIIPSCTELGMAALLPHNNLIVNAKGKIEIDGIEATHSNREKILQQTCSQSGVLKFDTFIHKTRDEKRAYIKDKKVIYIYHDCIDQRGDNPRTENETFAAAKQAIEEIDKAIATILQDLQASIVYVTADHGFLYQCREMQEIDRGSFEKGGEIFKAHKRFLIGKDLPPQTHAWKIKAQHILPGSADLDIVIPKGNSRFHFAGGARFVHGGAMLQEIMIPVLKIQPIRSVKEKEQGKISYVNVELIDNTRKISNNRQRFKFLQTSRVEGKTLPLHLQIAFYDKEGELLSDEHTFIFDGASNSLEDMQKEVIFSFKSKSYDKHKEYYMIFSNIETGREYKRIPFKFNIGIVSEFDLF